jgi:RND family efflux transporter MFP subunit
LEAEAQVGSAKAALAEAKSQRSVSEADQERYSVLEAYSHITAPFTGVVTKRYADTGALIQAGTASDTQSMPVVRLAQWSKLRLIVPVPESAVPDLQLGGEVEVRVPSLKRNFKGKIARFADALSDETRTMHTEIDVENADGTLVEGMYAETDVELKHPQSALSVPIQAIQRNGDDAKVVVVKSDGTIEPRAVKLGAEGNDRIEVISGLSEGERLVVGNLGQYSAGEKVQPKLITGTQSPEGRF